MSVQASLPIHAAALRVYLIARYAQLTATPFAVTGSSQHCCSLSVTRRMSACLCRQACPSMRPPSGFIAQKGIACCPSGQADHAFMCAVSHMMVRFPVRVRVAHENLSSLNSDCRMAPGLSFSSLCNKCLPYYKKSSSICQALKKRENKILCEKNKVPFLFLFSPVRRTGRMPAEVSIGFPPSPPDFSRRPFYKRIRKAPPP